MIHSCIVRVSGAALCLVLLLQIARAENNAYNAALNSITVDELYDHLSFLADDTLEGRDAGSRGGRAAARYLATQLKQLGAQPAGTGGSFQQPFRGAYQNVLAKLPGHDESLSDEVIVVGAHYDHVGYGTPQTSYGPIGNIHNGADDNASGVSVMLEVIEAFVSSGAQPRRTILFAFWDGEEQGLLGSKYFASQPTVPMNDIRLAINIDMVGHLRNGRLQIGGTRSGVGLRQLASNRSLPSDMWLDFDWELKENSDHWPFFIRGVPVMLLHTGLHDYYHRPSDDVERINQQGLHQVAAYLFDILYRAANTDALPLYRRGAQHETPWTKRERERPLAPLPARLGIAFRDAQKGGDPREGIVVTRVSAGSPASAAGVRVGDRIVRVDETLVNDEKHFQKLIQRANAKLQLNYHRGSNVEDEPTTTRVQLRGQPLRLGISWRHDRAEPTSVYLTRVVPGTPADVAKLRIHDRILAVNGERYDSLNHFSELLQAALDDASAVELSLQIERRGRVQDVTLDLL